MRCKNTPVLWSAVLWLYGVFIPTAQAELTIQITKGVAGTVPIAVISQPSHEGAYPQGGFEEMAEIIRNDLRTSGHFRPLSSRQMPQTSSDVLNPGVWQDLGVENLVEGQVEPSGNDRYQVHFKLFDVFKMQAGASPAASRAAQLNAEGELLVRQGQSGTLVAKAYPNITPGRFRALAHHISDIVFERLTGIRGAFSTRIAYVTTKKIGARTVYQLEVADADGFQPKVLVESFEPIMSPSWSPDARSIAFVSFERKRAEIYMMDVATGQRQLLTRFPGINGAPAWSPDGTKLALVLSKDGSPKIYTLDIASKRLEQVTTGYSIDTEPTWTKDGRALFFTSNRGGKPQIYQVELRTKRSTRVTFEGNYNARPKLTPDNKYLVMIHRGTDGNFHIATQQLATGEVRVLTDSSLDESPSISPNGAMVLYGTKVDDRRVLGLVTIDGRGHLRLPAHEGSVQEPAWSPFLS